VVTSGGGLAMAGYSSDARFVNSPATSVFAATVDAHALVYRKRVP